MAALPTRPLLALLREMRSMIERVDDDGYAAPAPGRSSGGIGSHVRHCLDHIHALVAATRSGFCAYDRRERGTRVESSRTVALGVIADLEARLSQLDCRLFEWPVEVETQIDASGSMFVTTSTVGRELVFVASHTVHHNAIVAQLLRMRGIEMGSRFGLAPSTPSHPSQPACAQ
jgi:hypothetical protein